MLRSMLITGEHVRAKCMMWEEKNIQSSQPIDSCHIVSSHVRVLLSASAAGSHHKLPADRAELRAHARGSSWLSLV